MPKSKQEDMLHEEADFVQYVNEFCDKNCPLFL